MLSVFLFFIISKQSGTREGTDLVKDAAKEAVKGVGFDLLIVCGFAFDPHVLEETKRYGKLTVLMARMNNDLSMGNDLLKKTGTGSKRLLPSSRDRVGQGGETTADGPVGVRGCCFF